MSKDNLGDVPGLVAAAALMFDYMMTVVVSIVAGVFAIASAFPWLHEHKVFLSIVFVSFITLLNLRGAKESGTLFAIPTYGFIVAIACVDRPRAAGVSRRMPEVGVEVEPLPDAATVAGSRGDLRDPEGVLPRRHRAHRCRGDLRTAFPPSVRPRRRTRPRPSR